MELKGGNIHLLTWRVLLPNKNYILAPNVFSTNVEFNEGHLELPLKLIVNAPYYTLRTAAQKFIIDEQGDFPLGVDVMLEAIHHS